MLLVEHDESIAGPLIEGLARHGIVADRVATAAEARTAAPHDVLLLGPGAGPAAAGRDATVPVIVLGAGGPEVGRGPGADLVARIRAARPAPAADPVRTYGPLRIDTRSRQIRLHGVPIPLAPKEYDLLVVLAAVPGAIVDRRHILDTVWEPNFLGPGRTLDFHVASLRRKLGDAGWIENRRGVGFRLVVPA
ncbi:winged helix-turn-helix domain-containing protein [Actinoplanes nipponensis]|uniref:winged helix-turn-helix domain-containing protein n=1 Tax=Actinoplanes nipponensis TaxID=135950 RepID=UPI0019443082|nr:response regulator transcription factor [Actinoplanes nipponensis]